MIPTREQILAEPAGARLDAWVSEHIMGVKVVGEAACWAPDGCWSVLPGIDISQAQPDGNEPSKLIVNYDKEVRPVYQAGDDLWGDKDDPLNHKLNGISAHCLDPVPWYSTDPGDAWRVAERLAEGEYVKVRCEVSHYHGHYCTVSAPDESQRRPNDLVKRDAVGVWGETMPLSVCRAALLAVLAD